MSPTLTALLIVWGLCTAVLVILMIYRGTLTMHEDDQLFLDTAESHMEKEQAELMARVNRITPAVRLLGAASGVLIVVIAGMWIYEWLTRMTT